MLPVFLGLEIKLGHFSTVHHLFLFQILKIALKCMPEAKLFLPIDEITHSLWLPCEVNLCLGKIHF